MRRNPQQKKNNRMRTRRFRGKSIAEAEEMERKFLGRKQK